MTITDEMRNAINLIENTNDCIFITGKAGTGKTTFLKYIVENTSKNYVVTASTGIAAVNAHGATLHSTFQIPLNIQDPDGPLRGRMSSEKTELFCKMDMLIIDEVSMVRPDILDYVDHKLRFYRLNDEPFGGVQVVMFGDLYQLPPVVKKSEKKILSEIYRGYYFFYARVWEKRGFHVIELSNVFRQTDKKFIRILNNIREYKITNVDINDLDEVRDRRESQRFDNHNIHICAFKRDVKKINERMLGEPTHTFKATYTGKFKETMAPCDDELRIRVGARVMMLINDPLKRFYNGSMGTVTGIKKKEISVDLDNGFSVTVGKNKWVINDYAIKDGKITTVEVGSCTQFPVSLAWAITIHKSQGLTFDNITLHCKRVFAPGQLYVALSRCRTMEGIVSEDFIGKQHIIPDKELLAFNRACKKCNMFFDGKTYSEMNLK